ncbi:MAG: AI-2E family transporter [Candidatus Nanopelagicales bacterium]
MSEQHVQPRPGVLEGDPDPAAGRVILFSPRNVWRIGWTIFALVAIGLMIQFIIGDGGAVIFTVLMAWFASIAMEPAVAPLSRHMKRGLATGLVMLLFGIAVVVFVIVFGQLLVDQVGRLIAQIPELITQVLDKIAQQTGTKLDIGGLLKGLNIDPGTIASYAGSFLSSALSIVGTVLTSVFGVFTFALFTFYLSADGPRLRLYLASLFPDRLQTVVTTVWDTTATKTGNYVAARVVLATINSVTTGIVFWAIGMPYWLALAIWTGVVAQFVPTIGTYIAIILPVIVGFISPTPWLGLAALVWALLYQQVENLTIEPRISARAVDVHPAVAFAAVMLGAALFGAAGALLAIPVGAMLLSLMDIYQARYDLVPELAEQMPKPRTQNRRRAQWRQVHLGAKGAQVAEEASAATAAD